MKFGEGELEERRLVCDVAHNFCADSKVRFALIKTWG